MLSSPHLSRPRWADWLAAGLVIIFVVSGILTLRNYGMTWDEGLGNFFFGERYLYYFTTFQPKYLEFLTDLPELHQPNQLYLFRSWMRDKPQEFPALMDTVSAGTMHLLAYDLGWMDPVDAFHLPKVLIAGVLLWALYRFASRRLGVVVALTSLAFLATFPRFWGDMHFNPKDIPDTVLFGLAIFAFWNWMEHPTWRWVVLTGLIGGAAVAVKANGIFLPFVLGLALIPLAGQVVHWRTAWRAWFYRAFQIGVMCLVALVLYVGSWPYLYVNNNPITGLKEYWRFILTQGGRTGLPTWNAQPIQMVIATMPEWMLAFVVLGIAVAIVQLVRTRKPIYSLVLAWFAFPLVRISMPGSVNFDGIRHFLEFVPAAALLAGLAAGWLVERVSAARPNLRFAVAGLVIAGIVVNTLFNFLNFGIYQHLYYNTLVGSFPGGGKIFGEGEDTDYWAGSFRQAMAWIDANGVSNSYVNAPVCYWLADMTGPLWLRPDVKAVASQAFYTAMDTHQPVYLILLKLPREYPDWTIALIQNRQPIHVISLQGVPLVNIYQVSP
jgi:hypothetical protein